MPDLLCLTLNKDAEVCLEVSLHQAFRALYGQEELLCSTYPIQPNPAQPNPTPPRLLDFWEISAFPQMADGSLQPVVELWDLR